MSLVPDVETKACVETCTGEAQLNGKVINLILLHILTACI